MDTLETISMMHHLVSECAKSDVRKAHDIMLKYLPEVYKGSILEKKFQKQMDALSELGGQMVLFLEIEAGKKF